MKRASLLLALVLFSLLSLYGQKPTGNPIDFEYKQLPLYPLDENIQGYLAEFVIAHEEELVQMEQDALYAFDNELAEHHQHKADAIAEYEYRRDFYEEYVEQARKEHQIRLEEYNKTLEPLGFVQKLAYKEDNPPPKFVMPKKAGPTPPRFRDPKYYPPKEIEILTKKEVMQSTYLRIEGYEPVEDQSVRIIATLYKFESKEPVVTTVTEKYYDKASQTTKSRVVTQTDVEAKYPIALEVIDEVNNKVLLNEVFGGDFTTFSNDHIRQMETSALNYNLKAIAATLNSNYGHSTQTRHTSVVNAKAKKFEYPEYQEALEKAMSFYNSLNYGDTDKSATMREAIAIWEKAITEYVPDDNKARINEKILKSTYRSLSEAYLWLNDFDKANLYLTKLFAFKMKDDVKAGLDTRKDFINDLKARFLANQ